MIEHRRARRHRRKKRLQLVEQPLVEHARVRSRFIHVVLENVPAGEDQVVESGQRNKLFNLRRTPVGALAQSHRSHLSQRPDRFCQPLANRLHARHKRGRNRTHARDHYSQLPFRGLDRAVGLRVTARLRLRLHVILNFCEECFRCCRRFCGLVPCRHILAASSVRICMDVQTLYVLVSGGTFANESGQTRRKSVQRGGRIIERRRSPCCGRVQLTIRSCRAARLRLRGTAAAPFSTCVCSSDEHDKYFALDSGANFLHSEITS